MGKSLKTDHLKGKRSVFIIEWYIKPYELSRTHFFKNHPFLPGPFRTKSYIHEKSICMPTDVPDSVS